MARVSVLTPTYQHAAFIGDCVRSVLAQNVQDWEMVIVDDDLLLALMAEQEGVSEA